MRKRLFNWQGQRFAFLSLEGEPGLPLDQQSDGLFTRAAMELASLGLSLDRHVTRTRMFGRTRDARTAASNARSAALTGISRASGSSYISPGSFHPGRMWASICSPWRRRRAGRPAKSRNMTPRRPSSGI